MSLNKISYFIFCLFFSVNFCLSAQFEAKEGNEIKNYLNVWHDSGVNDTLRLESLNKAIWLLRNYNIDTRLSLQAWFYKFTKNKLPTKYYR